MRSMPRLKAGVVLVATLGLLAAMQPGSAAESLKVTVKYKVVSVVFDEEAPEGPTLHLEFDGSGVSSSLGKLDVATEVTQVLSEGCDPATTHHVLTSVGGALEIEGDDLVCPSSGGGNEDHAIDGTWSVTGSSGDLAGTTGSGTLRGRIGGQGNVVATFDGTLT